MKKTQLEYVGVGYNKTDMGPLDVWIKIFQAEQNAGQDGDQMQPVKTVEFNVTGDSENKTVGSANISGDIKAKWLPLNSNRFTAPTMRVGERVQIWKESDTGRYWWSSMGLDESLRKRETIIFGISANDADGSGGRDPSNMYWFEMSSHSQKIALITSKHLGEKAAYQFYFDLAAGKVVLRDDVGNEITLESLERHIKLLNADGTFFELLKKDITGDAPGNITLKAGKTMTLKAGTALNMTAGSVTTLKTPIFQGSR